MGQAQINVRTRACSRTFIADKTGCFDSPCKGERVNSHRTYNLDMYITTHVCIYSPKTHVSIRNAITSCTVLVPTVSASLSARSDSAAHHVTLPPAVMPSVDRPPAFSAHSTLHHWQMSSSANLNNTSIKRVNTLHINGKAAGNV